MREVRVHVVSAIALVGGAVRGVTGAFAPSAALRRFARGIDGGAELRRRRAAVSLARARWR